MSEADSIINANAIADIFAAKFLNQHSKFVWYGNKDHLNLTQRNSSYSMKLKTERISTASHMSPLFSPTNAYYGHNGEKLIYYNSLDARQTASCKEGKNIWFSAWGYKEQGKSYARLTWNPYFYELEIEIGQLIETSNKY